MKKKCHLQRLASCAACFLIGGSALSLSTQAGGDCPSESDVIESIASITLLLDPNQCPQPNPTETPDTTEATEDTQTPTVVSPEMGMTTLSTEPTVPTSEPVARYKGPFNINDFDWNSDGTRLVAAMSTGFGISQGPLFNPFDGLVMVYDTTDINNPELIACLEDAEGRVKSVDISDDDAYLVVGSAVGGAGNMSGRAYVYEFSRSEVTLITETSTSSSIDVTRFKQDSSLFAFSTSLSGRTARAFVSDAASLVRPLPRVHTFPESSGITSLAFQPNTNKLLIAGGQEGCGTCSFDAMLYDLDNPDQSPTLFSGSNRRILGAAFNQDGTELATASFRQVNLHNPAQPGGPETTINDAPAFASSVAYHNRSPLLAVGGWEDKLTLYHAETNECLGRVDVDPNDPSSGGSDINRQVSRVAFHPNENRLAVSTISGGTNSGDNIIRLYQLTLPVVEITAMEETTGATDSITTIAVTSSSDGETYDDICQHRKSLRQKRRIIQHKTQTLMQ